MVFNATLNNIQLYRGGQCYWWRKPEYLYYWPAASQWQTWSQCCIEYTAPWAGFEITTL